ncbi:MAG: Na+/H+ antiporter NhaC family protein, partial [Candidatus Marinimicrobia bacterium]|nr:Na+/H+ antiporter NhaC family protein [Candidatus Neomarinimicrobiota bacterium]
ACFGDHCSPISDTTIMSSMASGSDHIDHVKTQMPYALLAAGVAIVVGYIPAGFNFNPVISIVMGIGLIYLIHRFIAKPVPESGS